MSGLLQKAHFAKTGLKATIKQKRLRRSTTVQCSEFVLNEYLEVTIEVTNENEFLAKSFWSKKLFRLKTTAPRDLYSQFDERSALLLGPYEVVVDLYHVVERDIKGGKDYLVIKLKSIMDGIERKICICIPHDAKSKIKPKT